MQTINFLFLASLLCVVGAEENYDSSPVFSRTYIVKGSLMIPYAELFEPFAAWYDAPAGSSRIDYYGGMVKTYQLQSKGQYGSLFKLAPVTTEKTSNIVTCLEVEGTEQMPTEVQSILPDLTGFKRIGKMFYEGVDAEVWNKVVQINDKVNNYTMLLTWKQASNNVNYKQPVPLFYEMKGFNTLLGSHYDHYYLSYSDYSFEKPDPSNFQIPPNMKCGGFPGPGINHLATFNPMREFINEDRSHLETEWERFHRVHNKRPQYKSNKEHLMRQHVFEQNFRYIQSKNRAGLTFKLAVNHLADRTTDELRYLRGSRVSANRTAGLPFPYADEQLVRGVDGLPESIDWRLFGAVTAVKDQSVCGSCWSFGTTGAVEGAYFLATHHQVRLSQQALVDCSWGFGNNGCDGGEDFRAYAWIKEHGLPSEADYGSYLGQDGYCHIKGLTPTAKISGFVDVTPENEDALKLALVEKGPISISIDASLRSFSYYSHGVYYDPQCGNTTDKLDHAVVLVGYGKLAGEPYWLVKNSWSNYWGEEGYILISPKDNNCGVTCAPTYVVLD